MTRLVCSVVAAVDAGVSLPAQAWKPPEKYDLWQKPGLLTTDDPHRLPIKASEHLDRTVFERAPAGSSS